MQSMVEREIVRRLNRYCVGAVSLQEFDSWFVSATAGVDRTGPPSVIDLSYEVFGRLAEYSNGDWSEAELKGLLRQIAAPARITAAS